MAPPPPDHQAQEGLRRGLPCRRVRLHHHPHVPLRPDRLHGLLQGRRAQCPRARAVVEPRGRGALVPVLQC